MALVWTRAIKRGKEVNKLFAFILFAIGIALVLASACANPVMAYVNPSASLLNTWGIIWRIGLGLLLIVLGVFLNNLDGLGGHNDRY